MYINFILINLCYGKTPKNFFECVNYQYLFLTTVICPVRICQVAGGQDYEVNYEKNKTGKTGDEVKKAVKTEGNSREKVEKKLEK